MKRFATRLARLALIVLPLVLAGCAVEGPEGDGAYVPRSEPAARIALRPEYRVFYDALADYGDWDLIEPYGYVFRPRVDPLAWRPYSYGYWAPTDQYGWVWMSSDDFGWATDHYGRWFYDDYKGWVWTPGIEWAPAWVTWQMNDQYLGWSPLGPNGYDMYGARIPGGPYLYSPLPQFTSTDVHAAVVTADRIAPELRESLHPVSDVIERDGVRIANGPSIARIEHASGFPIGRVRLEDAVPAGNATDALIHPGRGSLGAAPDGAAGGSAAGVRIESIRRAAIDVARSTQQLSDRPAPPPARISVVRPFGVPGKPAPAARPAGRAAAPADTTRR